MAYTTGIADDMDDVHAALIAAAVNSGWTWSGAEEVIHRDGSLFVHVQNDDESLRLVGRTSMSAGDMPNPVRMCPLGSPLRPIQFPLIYHIFHWDYEIYMVVSYSVDSHQFCAFGKSQITLPGTGLFVAATSGTPSNNAYPNWGGGVGTQLNGATPGAVFGTAPAAMACYTGQAASSIASQQQGLNEFVNSGLVGDGWGWVSGPNLNKVGFNSMAPLLATQPSRWNSEASLLPIRYHVRRPEGKVSLVAEMRYARHIRIDNIEPGDLVTLGPERWKVFPWHRKNTVVRDGGWDADHSGTFGWAIRYEGP